MSVTFPDQATIISYINGHPIKTAGIDDGYMQRNFPDSMQKVAEYFANKKIELADIQTHIRKALVSDSSVDNSSPLSMAFVIYDKALKDLLEGASYTLSPDKKWIRLV